MTAPLPPLPVGDRFKDTNQFRLLGRGGGDELYECWKSAIDSYSALAVREALERAAQKYAGQRLVDGNRVSEELRAMIEEYK